MSGAASVQASPGRSRRGSSSASSSSSSSSAPPPREPSVPVKVEKEKLPRPSAAAQRSGAGVAASRLPGKEVVLRCIDRLDMDIARVEARVAMAKAKRSQWLRRRDQRRREREDKEQESAAGGCGDDDMDEDEDDNKMDEDSPRRTSGASSPRRHNKEDRERRLLLERRAEERDARLRRLRTDPVALAAEISAENLRRAAASTAALGLGKLSYAFGGSLPMAPPGATALPVAAAEKRRNKSGPLFSGTCAITGVPIVDVDKSVALARRWASIGGTISVDGVDFDEEEKVADAQSQDDGQNGDSPLAAAAAPAPFVNVVSGSEWVQRGIRAADRFGLNLGRGNKHTWLVESWPWEERAQAERKSARKHKWEVERRRMERERARRLQQQLEEEGKCAADANAAAAAAVASMTNTTTTEAVAISWRPRPPPPGMLLAQHLVDPRAAATNEAAGIVAAQPGMGAAHAAEAWSSASATLPSAPSATSVAAVTAVVAAERAKRFEQTAANAAKFRTTRRLWKKRLASFEEQRRSADQAARRTWIAEERERGSDPYARAATWDGGVFWFWFWFLSSALACLSPPSSATDLPIFLRAPLCLPTLPRICCRTRRQRGTRLCAWLCRRRRGEEAGHAHARPQRVRPGEAAERAA